MSPLIKLNMFYIFVSESLRRKDEVIKQALIEKQTIVANILNIPKTDVEHITGSCLASELPIVEKEPAELIFTAIGQGKHPRRRTKYAFNKNLIDTSEKRDYFIAANQLIELLNSALTVSETETVLATQSATASAGCEATGCPAPRVHSRALEPSIPVSTLQPVCHSLASQLSQLLVSAIAFINVSRDISYIFDDANVCLLFLLRKSLKREMKRGKNCERNCVVVENVFMRLTLKPSAEKLQKYPQHYLKPLYKMNRVCFTNKEKAYAVN